jgi:hypothetical protein
MMLEPAERTQLFTARLERTAVALRKHGFEVVIMPDAHAARDFFFSKLPAGATVGYGGSKTVSELALIEKLRERTDVRLFDRARPGLSSEEKGDIERQCFFADVFIASANAVSEQGAVVNIDKWGNRTAAIEFGPKKVYLFVGRNKLAADLDAAVLRARHSAAVMNSMRFEKKTPCVQDGRCHDCNSPDRICSTTSIIQRCSPEHRIVVVLVNQDLGF